jgi:Uma2 family endonuclease
METMVRPPKTILEVYQSLPEGTLCQVINNQLIMSPAPADIHQKTLGKIYRVLTDFIEKKVLGDTRMSPSDVYLSKRNVFQPDIYFVANENIKRFEENGFHGAPDLVIEILSPATAKYDLEDKKDIYEQYGVKEYWCVDPQARSVQGWSLINGEFVSLPDDNGVIKSKLLNKEFSF